MSRVVSSIGSSEPSTNSPWSVLFCLNWYFRWCAKITLFPWTWNTYTCRTDISLAVTVIEDSSSKPFSMNFWSCSCCTVDVRWEHGKRIERRYYASFGRCTNTYIILCPHKHQPLSCTDGWHFSDIVRTIPVASLALLIISSLRNATEEPQFPYILCHQMIWYSVERFCTVAASGDILLDTQGPLINLQW